MPSNTGTTLSWTAIVRILVFVIAAAAAWSGAGLAIVPLTFGLLHFDQRPPDSIGLWLSQRRLSQFAAGLLLGTGMVLATAFLYKLVLEFHWERNPQVTSAVWLTGIWFYLKSAIVEELLFRGYGFQLLIESIGVRWTQALTAVLFAIYHVLNIGMAPEAALLVTGLGSLLFGYAYLKSGGVMLPIAMHAAWNFWQEQLTASSGRAQPGQWSIIRAAGPDPSFFVSYGILLLVTLAAAALLYLASARNIGHRKIPALE
jgi:membrane protease YdiL (CAAX protease family)